MSKNRSYPTRSRTPQAVRNYEWGSGPWLVRQICCGYDDGVSRYQSWEEAHRARCDYVDLGGGHERNAIVQREVPDA